jgi:hypothetical protein
MPDEIMRELWAVKDRSAKAAGYDIDKLCRRFQKRDRTTEAPVVDLSAKPRKSRRAARS